jgi:hypothetical protein
MSARLFLILALLSAAGCDPRPNRARASREEALRQLATADSIVSLNAAVGRLGNVYVFQDKAWIAVWCARMDSEPADLAQFHWHDAIALTSSGEWLESTRDYGAFLQTPKLDPGFNERIADERARSQLGNADSPQASANLEGLERERMMHALTTAPTIEDAKKTLIESGFAHFDGPDRSNIAKINVTDADVTAPTSTTAPSGN